MKKNTLSLLVPCLVVALGIVPCRGQVNTTNPEPEDPTGNAGAFKGMVETGGGYNPHNGNANRSITDLQVPGAPGEYGLDFTRHWNSTDPAFSPFGQPGPRPFGNGGWTHSWNWSASVDQKMLECSLEDGNPCVGGYLYTYIHYINIEYPDGRTARFFFSRTNQTPESEDPDVSDPEPYPPTMAKSFVVDDHLVGMTQDGRNFSLYLADGGSVDFEWIDAGPQSGYRATKVTDSHGLATILSYEGARLSRVAGPDGRSLFLTWGSFGGTTPTVIKKVGWGRTPNLLSQTVEYCYALYSIPDPENISGDFIWYALTTASYTDDINSGQLVKATYTYVPVATHDTTPLTPSPKGRGPLLTSADDPRFEGAMTRIKYIFRGGPGGEPFCQSVNPMPVSIGPSMMYAPFPVEQELNFDTEEMVSQLWIPCNGTSQTGKRTETRGAGGKRTFYYGKAGGLEPGAWFEELPNGEDTWHPPESYPGSGTHGYNAGFEVTRLTDFADNPDPTTTPTDFHHNRMVKPYRSFDARGFGFVTEYTFQRGPDYDVPPNNAPNNGRLKQVLHRDADNTTRTYNWDIITPGTLDRDEIHIPNTYNHWLHSQKDERGKTTTYTRNGLRLVTKISYYDGPIGSNLVAVEEFTYNEFNQVTSHKLPSLAMKHYVYEGSRLVQEWNSVDGPGDATIYTYDGFDRVWMAQNGRARINGKQFSAMMEYNSRHQVTKVTYPATGSGADPFVTYEYDKYGNCTAITNELNQRSIYTYDSYRRCTSYTEPVDASACGGGPGVPSRTWNWVYDRVLSNNLTSVNATTHTSGKWRLQIEPAYNDLGDRRATVRNYDYNDRLGFELVGAILSTGGSWNYGSGAMHSYTYDAVGNKASYSDPGGRLTTYEYDKRNRLVTTTEKKRPGGRDQITRYVYDATGNKTKVTFPDLETQEWFSHDPFGQPREFKDERGNPTHLEYWPWGPMKKLAAVITHRVRDGSGTGTEDQRTSFYFDLLGRPQSTYFPDQSNEITLYEYGQPRSWKTRRNQTKTTSYDARGRETNHTWNDGTPGITRTWDNASRLLTLQNRFSAIDYSYDHAGQVLTEGTSVTAGAGQAQTLRKQVSYCRYPSGEVSQLTYPNGTTAVNRFYTVRGQLESVGWGAESASYVYLLDGKVDYQAHSNGVLTDFEYDARGFIQTVLHQSAAGNLSKRTYYRDDRDRITAWRKDVNQGVNPMENGRGDRYAYDDEGQLYAASYQAEDPNGNATTPQRNDIFRYDELGNRKESNYLASRGWMDFTRRNNGLNQYAAWMPYSYVYYDDNFNEDWVSPGNGVTMADGWITASYNALNQPVAMGSTGLGNNFLWYGHDPLGRCVKRWMGNAAGEPVGANPATYLYYDGWNLVQEGSAPNNPTRLYVHGGRADEIVAQITPGNGWERYFHYDARGHCTLQTDASGGIVEQYDYDAFGFPYFYDASGNATTVNGQPGSPWGNRFLFTGREWLGDLRIYDFRNRHYQPELGRFLQPDPIQFAAGDYNLYRYCHNDPVNKTDPFGLDTYQQNRKIDGDELRSNYNLATHSFTFTTNPDGTIKDTYSWGNSANSRGWNQNQREDRTAAEAAMASGKANKVGDSKLDPYVDKAFKDLNKKENEHQNWGIARNCKWESKDLLNKAKELKKADEKAAQKAKPQGPRDVPRRSD